MIRPKKLHKDPNCRAHQIATMLTEGCKAEDVITEKSARMAEIGRKGGIKGGPSRKNKLSRLRRKQIARKAAEARWKRSPGNNRRP